MCVQSRMHFRVMNVFFLMYLIKKNFFFDLVKAKPFATAYALYRIPNTYKSTCQNKFQIIPISRF